MKRLVIAAFIFGMATGYCGALWQICAQKSLRGAQEMRVSPAEAGSASVAAGGGSKVSEQSSSARGGHGWGKRRTGRTGWTKNREMEDDERGTDSSNE